MTHRHLVLANYYPWFWQGEFSTGQWADTPIGPYATNDSASVKAMIQQAAGAGINGFITTYEGQAGNGQALDLLLAEAGTSGFSALPGTDLSGAPQVAPGQADPVVVARWITDELTRASNPAYLHADAGRPVVLVYGTWLISPSAWAAVRSQLQASGLNPFIMGDSLNPACGFDGYYNYDVNHNTSTALGTAEPGWAWQSHVAQLVDPSAHQQLWTATVSPGEDDHFTRPTNPTVQPRLGETRYDQTWQSALSTSADWVMVTSWNEWYEGTNVQPDDVNGSQALTQTAHWSSVLHG